MEWLEYAMAGVTTVFGVGGIYFIIEGVKLRNMSVNKLSRLESRLKNEILSTNPVEDQKKYGELNDALDRLKKTDYNKRVIIHSTEIVSVINTAKNYDLLKS